MIEQKNDRLIQQGISFRLLFASENLNPVVKNLIFLDVEWRC